MKGIPGAPGIAIGKAKIIDFSSIDELITTDQCLDAAAEIKRYDKGLTVCIEYFNSAANDKNSPLSKDELEIFEGYIEILNDEEINEEIKALINKNNLTAESAIDKIYRQTEEEFKALANDYFASRAEDISGIRKKLMTAVKSGKISQTRLMDEHSIIIARDLSPADISQLDINQAAGFIMEQGSKNSHAAIIARSIQVPCVVGLNDIISQISDGATVIIDGLKGEVMINPGPNMIKEYTQKIEQEIQKQNRFKKSLDQPSWTKDQHKVRLALNAGTVLETRKGKDFFPDGIGLFRTEFFFMEEKNFPSVERQFNLYKTVVSEMPGRLCVFRLLDIGGDKPLPYAPYPQEMNPFLGWRAIRYCLDHIDILTDQLKALIKASHFGRVAILIPMVSFIEEVIQIKQLIHKIKSEFKNQAIPFDEKLEIGVMIETPSAVAIAPELAEEVDFFSIGTNDLVQYTLAVDRGNSQVASLYQELHPAVLRLIAQTVQAAHNKGIWTGICGELAGRTDTVALLVGLGIDELSMSAASLPAVKHVLRAITFEEAKQLALEILNYGKVQDIIDCLTAFVNQKGLNF